MSLSKRFIFFLYLIFCGASAGNAQIRLPHIICDSMILQRDQPLEIWGWASPGERLILHFKGKQFSTTAGADEKLSLIHI